jgi:hypothetical protein
MKKILFGIAITLAAVTVMAASGRSLNGAPLTYNLNGSDQFVGSATAASGVAEIKLPTGSNIMIWCADAGYFINGRSGTSNADGGSVAGRMVPCAAGEKYPVGLLQPDQPYVSISNMDALFFERK